MKNTKFFLTVISMLFCAVAFAQDITVTGTVKDASTGEGIPFASIQIKDTMTGGSTDLDGNYEIKAPADGILIFSSIGYVTLEVAVAGNAVHNLMLEPDTHMLEETIVVAFGTATKESFTGSATVVKSDDIAKIQTTDVSRALEGMVAGVQMTTATGTLGSSASIQIRGASSISAGSSPLVIVDGVPSSMDAVNASDIESMTVLKDAASNALYGARGAAGVIMITTKKAKLGDAVVNVDAKWGLNTKALKNYDYITDPGQYYETYYASLRNYYIDNGESASAAHIHANSTIIGDNNSGGLGYIVFDYPSDQALIGSNGRLNPNATLGRKMSYNGQDYYITPDNWLDETYRNTLRQEYNVSVAGTTGKASVYASFGYLNDKGIIYGSDMQRYTARLRTDYQAKEWLKIGGNFAYMNTNLNNSNSDEGASGSTGNVFAIATAIAPIYPVYIRDGEGNVMYDKYGYKVYDYGTGANAGLVRPYLANSNALQGAILDKFHQNANIFNLNGYAEVKFLKDFTFTFNAGTNMSDNRATSISNKLYGQYATVGGSIGKSHSRGMAINLQQLLNYNKTIGVHHIAALVGHETYSSKSYSLSASKSQMFSMENDELNGAVVDGKSSSSSMSEYNNEGFIGRVQYDYDNRIFTSASYRCDASSRFHPDHRWGHFWSLGGGWIINQEAWFPSAPWIDMLKLKASIGSQGNDSIGNYLYTDTYYMTSNEGTPSIQFSVKGNEDITWETNTNINTGVDFDFLRGKVSGSVEYFYRKTTDMLFFFTVPKSTGYDGYYDNIGDMRNQGIELGLNINIMRRRHLNWDFYFNATHYTNKITMLPEDKKTTEIDGHGGYVSGTRYIGEGLPLNTFYLPKYAGVNPDTGESMWYQTLEDGTQTTTTTYSEASEYLCGDPTPLVYGGFGTSFSWKGLDFSAAFTYSIGGLAYDSGYAGYMGSPTQSSAGQNFHKDILNAWTPDNKDSNIPRFQYLDTYTAANSDRFLTDASYLNFQNAQIGYTLPERVVKKMHISKLRVYVACDNIIYWSMRQGLDPRQSFSGSTSSVMSSPVRTISGGIQLSF